MFRFVLLLLLPLLTFSNLNLKAQSMRKVLFLGNSYTAVNNLPQIIQDVALSVGDTLVFDSYTPGGYQLMDHLNDGVSQNKIMAAGWNYVVLQGQSQEPITHKAQFNNAAVALNQLIAQYNPCAVSMFYMTWGRKNGDVSNCASFPVMCTYEGMDSTLRSNYLNLTSKLNAEVSPVSIVWNYLRKNHPNINLYQVDESHPSVAGSYAAACSFYAMLFKKDPTLISYNNGLSASDASIIKNTVKTQVFDSLHLWDFKQTPVSDFKYETGPGMNEVLFYSISGIEESYFWDFGNGMTSSSPSPSHSYLSNGTYTVELTTTNCDLQGLHSSTSDTIIQICNHTPSITTSNPWLCKYDTLWTQTANSYQWFSHGSPIPETNQYISDYQRYNNMGFSVRTTVNGCSELSRVFNGNPQWSGYYFDVSPTKNPCVGDTVKFKVLHINGFLSGSEIIRWYRNDTLLSFMNNIDSLLIYTGGKFESKVIDSNSNCPLDTTSYSIEFKCITSNVKEAKQRVFWNLFPNPTSESINIQFSHEYTKGDIHIYNSIGELVKVTEASTLTTIPVMDLPNGLYFIRLTNNSNAVQKFIKQ